MKNKIYISGQLIKTITKLGRQNQVLFENGATKIGFRTGQSIEIKCQYCSSLIPVKFYKILLSRNYVCQSCSKLGKLNPFYGKHHTEETKQKQAKIKNGKYVGNLNPFYGKHHTEETKQNLIKTSSEWAKLHTNPFHGKHHTEETKQHISKCSLEWAKHNIDHYKRMGIASTSRRITKTSPEKLTESWLISNNIPYKYNKIISNVGQFDFCVLNTNILIEVQGDYWHCNPVIYLNGPITERQKYKISRDIEKKCLATQLGYTLYYIWEQDINNNNFTALDELLHYGTNKI